MRRGNVAVAMTVTVEVDPKVWELTYGSYDDEDVVEYVRDRIQGSAAVEEECIMPDVNVRFRRPPKVSR